MPRTLVLGLDGATFEVLNVLMEDGELPNLRALTESGVSAKLQSTMPPVTGPAWLSLATGQSPGTTGIYDFIYRDAEADEFGFKYMDGTMYQGRSVWDYLSDEGVDVGIIDYPLLSPAYPVNGFMVAGGMGSVGHEVFPDTLDEELATFEKPKEHLDLRDDQYEDLTVFMDDMFQNLDRRATILEHVLENHESEFCWAVLQEPDWLQHMMWKCFDDSHPESGTVTDEERELFRNFWRRIDDIVGRCIELTDDETNIVIQSDHGFGPMYDRSFRLNTWLKQQGYLTPKSFASSHFWVKKRIRNLLSDVASAIDLEDWAPSLFDWGKNKTSSMAIQLNAVDLEHTVVFDPGHIGSMGGLYINEEGLPPELDEDELVSKIRSELLGLGEERGVGIDVYTPTELYGKKAEGSPDIIVRVDGTMIEDGGWDQPIWDDRPERLDHQNGSHRREGVLIASGPDFESGTIDEAYVWDLAPTLLHLYGAAIPDEMDGRVLTNILTTERSIEFTSDRGDGTDAEMSDEDREQVEQQLSDLGYFD